MEFKVHDPEEEGSLQDTVKAALQQIQEKNYDAELQDRGFHKAGSGITVLHLRGRKY